MPHLKNIGGRNTPEFARLYRTHDGGSIGLLLHPGVMQALKELKTPPDQDKMAAALKQAGFALRPFKNTDSRFGFCGMANLWTKTEGGVTTQGLEVPLPTTTGPQDMGSIYNLVCTLAVTTAVLDGYKGDGWNDRYQGLTITEVRYAVGHRLTFDLAVPDILSGTLKNEHWVNWQNPVGLAMKQALSKMAPWWQNPDPFWLVHPVVSWGSRDMYLNGPDGCRTMAWSTGMATEAKNTIPAVNALLGLMLLCGLIELQRVAWPW